MVQAALTRFPFHPVRVAGLFFCLASDTVQGFYFVRMQHSPIQAFTTLFVQSIQLYHQRHKTAHKALQRFSLRLHPLNRPRYQTDTTSHCTACDTLEGIHAPGRAQQMPDTTATPGHYTSQRSRLLQPPIIIRYIRGCRGAPCCGSMPDGATYRRPCQPGGVAPTVCGSLASAAPGAPAEGSASPPAQGQWSRRARSGTSTRRGSPAVRGAAVCAEPLAASAASLFGLSPDS